MNISQIASIHVGVVGLLALAACSGSGAARPPMESYTPDSGAPGVDANGPSADAAAPVDGGVKDASFESSEDASEGGPDGTLQDAASDGGASDGGASDGGASDGSASDGSASDGGASDGGASDGGTADAAGPLNPGSDAQMFEPQCKPNAQLGTPFSVPGVATFGAQPLVTVTGDELTLAWVVPAGDNAGNVFVADRASVSDPFGAPVALTPSGDFGPGNALDAAAPGPQDGATTPSADASAGSYFGFARVALSSDGLKVIGVSVEKTHFAAFVRSSRGGPFLAAPMEGNFDQITLSLNPGEVLADPVLSNDGTDLVYSRYGRSKTTTIYESTALGAGVKWSPGSPQGNASVQMFQELRKIPLSMSSDGLTLFVLDQADNLTYGVSRPPGIGSGFFSAQKYGAYFSLQTNAACTHFYYVDPTGSDYQLEEVQVIGP